MTGRDISWFDELYHPLMYLVTLQDGACLACPNLNKNIFDVGIQMILLIQVFENIYDN